MNGPNFLNRLKDFHEPRNYGNNIIARAVDERLMKVNQLKTDGSVQRLIETSFNPFRWPPFYKPKDKFYSKQ